MKKYLSILPGLAHLLLSYGLISDVIDFFPKVAWFGVQHAAAQTELSCLWGLVEISSAIPYYETQKYFVGLCVVTILSCFWTFFVCRAIYTRLRFFE